MPDCCLTVAWLSDPLRTVAMSTASASAVCGVDRSGLAGTLCAGGVECMKASSEECRIKIKKKKKTRPECG